ncbi:MAG: type II toxin-antitoxin system RelE/ParE family toxin [Intrasporangium sp.]|uniref:type II toxin-antitoxin system RelE family toxin n=1 Tax=Intrasporangium sp. TaxID=1925024 RepID=UPI002649D5B9|nr:type II toxin-antitoxin system RelE/ParE family toxin [Intrasporangium sp.]MDN5798332.1 type II toxin-antitoxin system RelE/ParE family toxin [Intrasporangium sp.]
MSDAAPVWSVVVTAGATRSLRRLPEKNATAIVEFITGVLPTNPLRLSKPLRYELEGWRIARRGDYRVTLRIDEAEHVIIVGRIEHRRDVYRPR